MSEEALKARIAELEYLLRMVRNCPDNCEACRKQVSAALTPDRKAPQAWLEAKAEIDANWPDPTPDRKAQT